MECYVEGWRNGNTVETRRLFVITRRRWWVIEVTIQALSHRSQYIFLWHKYLWSRRQHEEEGITFQMNSLSTMKENSWLIDIAVYVFGEKIETGKETGHCNGISLLICDDNLFCDDDMKAVSWKFSGRLILSCLTHICRLWYPVTQFWYQTEHTCSDPPFSSVDLGKQCQANLLIC